MTFSCDSFELELPPPFLDIFVLAECVCPHLHPFPSSHSARVRQQSTSSAKGVDEPATVRKFALLHVSGCRRISVQLLCNSVMHSADGHCFPREATLTGFEPVLPP